MVHNDSMMLRPICRVLAQQKNMMRMTRQPIGAPIVATQRSMGFLFRYRHFQNTIEEAKFRLVRLSNACTTGSSGIHHRFCSTCSIFDNSLIKNDKMKQLPIEQHPLFLQSQQLRNYSTTRPTPKTRHSKNMIDRLYNEQMFRTNREDEIPSVVDYARTIEAKPPLKWIRESWKKGFCEVVRRDKNKLPPTVASSPPTKIVNEYHYNDTPRTDDDDKNDPLKASRAKSPSKGLSVIEKKKRDVGMHDDDDDDDDKEYRNVMRQVHRSSGTTYSKTTSVRRKGETFTSVTTISTRSLGPDPDHDSDNEDGIDIRKFFSDIDDDDNDDDNVFADSDDDGDDDDDDHNDSQHPTFIDMPATASKTTQQRRLNTVSAFPKASPPPPPPPPQQQPSSNSEPTDDFFTSKETQKSSKSSSSWSISLNDSDFDVDHTDVNSSAASPTSTNRSTEHPTTRNSNDTTEVEGDMCYEWDHDTQKMKPILLVRSKDADISNSEPMKRANHDDMKSNFIASAEGEVDEYTEDMVDINNFLQSTKPRLVPREFENWWDRDDDLVNKAKRKIKFANIRKAQEEPLNRKCKTCPVCKRVFKGHSAFIDHAINKGNCAKDIDDGVKEQLKAQKIAMQTKKKEKNKRRRNFTADDLF